MTGEANPSVVRRLRGGDADAAARLDALYRRALLRFCRGYLGDDEDAEDTVQEVFARVLTTSDVPRSVRIWLYTIARNLCLNRLRDHARRHDGHDLPSASKIAASQTGFLSALVREERAEHLARAVETISPDEQEALRLRYAEQLSRQEIAEIVGAPVSVVKSRLYEGLEKLRQHGSLDG